MGRKAVALRLLQAGGQLETAASATSHPRRHHHYRYQKYRAHRSIADANADASNDCTASTTSIIVVLAILPGKVICMQLCDVSCQAPSYDVSSPVMLQFLNMTYYSWNGL